MHNKRVLVAMSGGVDSSVAAAILKEQGYEVIGATMKIWPKESCGRHGERSCCSLDDIEDARKVCSALGIKHYVLNFEKIFRKEVIDYFAKSYMKGRTPNPCIICNEKIKFGGLLKKAQELDCDFISTGHYARIENNGTFRLKESADKAKDQSYVLFCLKKGQLKKAIFPVGDLKKYEVRKKAKDLGFGVFDKKDSQEICFVMDNKYADFIKEYCGMESKDGDIVDSEGRILGRHKGYWNYTIGQRRGLGVSAKEPLYVTEIIPEKNLVKVGGFSNVKRKRFIVRDAIFSQGLKNKGIEAKVKIRYTHNKASATLRDIGDDKIEVEFSEPQEAITPGQAAVFYDGEYVLGGGWIDQVLG